MTHNMEDNTHMANFLLNFLIDLTQFANSIEIFGLKIYVFVAILLTDDTYVMFNAIKVQHL